jgi:hypothetical protein
MIAVLVIVLWLNTVKFGQSDADALEAIIFEDMHAFIDAYGRNSTRPKNITTHRILLTCCADLGPAMLASIARSSVTRDTA